MIRFSRITSSTHPFFADAFDLYAQSFPIHEQRLSKSQQNILSHPQYHCDAVLEDDTFCGILFSWEIGSLTYIEHFAVSPSLRGQGTGSRILGEFLKTHPLTVLEIDPPQDDISIRREKFYQRLGLVSNDVSHYHPPYRPQTAPHKLVVMSYPRTLSPAEYHMFSDYLQNTIMYQVY